MKKKKNRSIITLVFLMLLGGAGNLLAQDEDRLAPLDVPRFFFSVETINDWVGGVINHLEREGWRVYNPLAYGWGNLVDNEIAYIEMESVKRKHDRLSPRINRYVDKVRFLRNPGPGQGQLGSISLLKRGWIPFERLYSRERSGIRIPLILVRASDFSPQAPTGIKGRLSKYRHTDHFSGKFIKADKEKAMLRYLREREKEGWRLFADLDLPPEQLLGKRVAFVEDVMALFNSSLNFTEGFLVSGINLNRSDNTLINISDAEQEIQLRDIVRDEAGRPALLVSPQDVQGLQAEKELIQYFAAPRLGMPPGVHFVLVTDFHGALDLGLDPWSEGLDNRLRRLRGLGLRQIHILVEGEIARHRQWLKEVKSSIFYREIERDPDFIQLHPKKMDQQGWFQESLITWGEEAKARDATDLILVETDPELSEDWLKASWQYVELGELIHGMFVIEGGESLGQNVGLLPRGQNLTLQGRERFGFELMIDHLVKPESPIVLSGANKLSFYRDEEGWERTEAAVGGPTPRWKTDTQVSVGRILDKMMQWKFSRQERADVVDLISDALRISRQEKGDNRLAFIQQLEDLSPQLPGELRQGALRLSQYLVVQEGIFAGGPGEGQPSISSSLAELYLERMAQREVGAEHDSLEGPTSRKIRGMLKSLRKK